MLSETCTAPVLRTHCPCCGGTTLAFQRRMNDWSLVECADCGSVVTEAIPAASELERVYAELYTARNHYDAHRVEVETLRKTFSLGKPVRVGWERRMFFSAVKPGPEGKLLDIGCGTGLFIAAAAQRGWKPSGVEISREAAELGSSVHNLPVSVGRVEDSQFKDGTFDAVTAWEVAEHLVEPLTVMRRIRGLLRAGGVFAGSVPNYARPRYRFGENLGPASVPPVHLNYWTFEALRRTLTHAGFGGIEIRWPRFCIDLLRPLGSISAARVARFVKVFFGGDVPTSMFFVARRES